MLWIGHGGEEHQITPSDYARGRGLILKGGTKFLNRVAFLFDEKGRYNAIGKFNY